MMLLIVFSVSACLADVKFAVLLKHDRFRVAELERFVLRASTPGKGFGEEMSLPRLSKLVGRSSSELRLLKEFILKRCPNAFIEEAATKDVLFVTLEGSGEWLRSHSLVNMVVCLKADLPPKAKKRSGVLFCDVNGNENNTLVTPALVSSLYGVPIVKNVSSSSSSSQAVGMLEWNSRQDADLQQFFSHFAPHLVGQRLSVMDVCPNCSSTGTYDLEGELDVQWIMSMGQIVKTTFYEGALAHPAAWLAQVNAEANPPRVLSYSAGFSFTSESRFAWDVELLKAAARRITVVASSGDSGSACNIFNETQLYFPDLSPYITAVGGTQLGNIAMGHPVEVGWSGSEGGFNSNYPTPVWQQNAIERYLSGSGFSRPPLSYFNSSARGIPDISLLSNCMVFVGAGQVEVNGGTSFASPIFAGMIGLINSHRRGAGKTTLGFLNPLLYAHPGAFTDIVVGQTGDGTSKNCYGYWCTPQWDPVSGIGSPKFDTLLKIAMELP